MVPLTRITTTTTTSSSTVQPQTLTTTSSSAQPLPVPLPVPSPPPVELLTLPDETFHHMLCEIQQDPDRRSILNDFDTVSPNDDADDMNPHVWHDISTLDNITSIEMEIP